ncbi:hypothetical protein [Hymenobacter cellulosilyticus]|uniref:Uncharacterized protein n=1 Tax=Hymenobacter cellulosilyticus TaxID=2932248 RepID=A0A8T9Q7A8_9BACT|nr:hypothetical protein [Hymenobacter cellulosilyticus]UOQ71379.1 hypothetical protein MUN79_22570 [Hymenobacter cellulosilyticus]
MWQRKQWERVGLIGCLIGSSTLTAAGQQIVQGDSVYRSLQTNKSSLADIKRVMGWPSSKKKVVNIKYGHFLAGRSFTSKSLVGYTFRYKRQDVAFTIYEETHTLSLISFGPTANVVTAKGIRPGKSTFADVIAAYGSIEVKKEREGIYQRPSTDIPKRKDGLRFCGTRTFSLSAMVSWIERWITPRGEWMKYG